MERFNEVDEFHGKSFVGKTFGHRLVSTKAHGMRFLGTGEKVFESIRQGGSLLGLVEQTAIGGFDNFREGATVWEHYGYAGGESLDDV